MKAEHTNSMTDGVMQVKRLQVLPMITMPKWHKDDIITICAAMGQIPRSTERITSAATLTFWGHVTSSVT